MKQFLSVTDWCGFYLTCSTFISWKLSHFKTAGVNNIVLHLWSRANAWLCYVNLWDCMHVHKLDCYFTPLISTTLNGRRHTPWISAFCLLQQPSHMVRKECKEQKTGLYQMSVESSASTAIQGVPARKELLSQGMQSGSMALPAFWAQCCDSMAAYRGSICFHAQIHKKRSSLPLN